MQIQKPATAKFLDGIADPETLPAWLREEDLDCYVAQYEQSGSRSPINWYRNIDSNLDLSFGGGGWVDLMDHFTTDLPGKIYIDGTCHWIQMERPKKVNEASLRFLEAFV